MPTSDHVIVWDLETVPDTAAFARIEGAPDLAPADAEAQMGDKFPKLPLHGIVCIGALIARWTQGQTHGYWAVRSLGAPHVGERSEAEIIQAFADRIYELQPQLVSFNGHGFAGPISTATPTTPSTSATCSPPTIRAPG